MKAHWQKLGRGRPTKRVPGTMNKLESAWASELEALGAKGELLWFQYEGMTLKLAKDTRYTPDFVWMDRDGNIVFDECKGWMEEAAFVRIKVAADKFPFRFRLIRKRLRRDGGGWDIKEVGE